MRIASSFDSLRPPCFAHHGARIMPPAFGAFTGGRNIDRRAFETVCGDVLRRV